MRVIITADLHLSDISRDSYRWLFLEQTLPRLIRKHHVQCVLILGDLTEAKDHHGAILVNRLVNAIYWLADLCPVVVLRGNHDGPDAANPYHAFLGRIEGVHWVGRPLALPSEEPLGRALRPILGGLGRVLFLPHTTDPSRDWKIEGKYDLALAHNAFEGAKGESGYKLQGIDPELIPAAKIVSGDIHVPQTFANVTYVGAPYLVDFGDDFDPRVLLIEDGKIKLMSIPSPGPQKWLVEISDLKQLARQDHLRPGDILKVRYKLPASKYADWPKIAAAIRKWGEVEGLDIFMVRPITERAASVAKTASAPNTRSDDEVFHAYGNQQGVDGATMKVGEKLL